MIYQSHDCAILLDFRLFLIPICCYTPTSAFRIIQQFVAIRLMTAMENQLDKLCFHEEAILWIRLHIDESTFDADQRLESCNLAGKSRHIGRIYNSRYILIGAGRFFGDTT